MLFSWYVRQSDLSMISMRWPMEFRRCVYIHFNYRSWPLLNWNDGIAEDKTFSFISRTPWMRRQSGYGQLGASTISFLCLAARPTVTFLCWSNMFSEITMNREEVFVTEWPSDLQHLIAHYLREYNRLKLNPTVCNEWWNTIVVNVIIYCI